MHRFEFAPSMFAGALALRPAIAQAQEHPNRLIRIIVGDAPGSGADIQMRLIARRLS